MAPHSHRPTSRKRTKQLDLHGNVVRRGVDGKNNKSTGSKSQKGNLEDALHDTERGDSMSASPEPRPLLITSSSSPVRGPRQTGRSTRPGKHRMVTPVDLDVSDSEQHSSTEEDKVPKKQNCRLQPFADEAGPKKPLFVDKSSDEEDSDVAAALAPKQIPSFQLEQADLLEEICMSSLLKLCCCSQKLASKQP